MTPQEQKDGEAEMTLLEILLSRPLTLLIVILFICNGIWHFYHGRPGTALYWLSGAAINICVEYLTPRFG